MVLHVELVVVSLQNLVARIQIVEFLLAQEAVSEVQGLGSGVDFPGVSADHVGFCQVQVGVEEVVAHELARGRLGHLRQVPVRLGVQPGVDVPCALVPVDRVAERMPHAQALRVVGSDGLLQALHRVLVFVGACSDY